MKDESTCGIDFLLSSDRLKVVVASACNDQPEYNMPGNLRLWSADTKKITQLPYHRTESSVAGGTQCNEKVNV